MSHSKSSISASGSQQTQLLFVAKKEDYSETCSPEDPPEIEWSSLDVVTSGENRKMMLRAQGLYSPLESEICAAYIPMSDSDMLNHPLAPYPSVTDPGIEHALLEPKEPVIYPEDGRELYLILCAEMNTCPINLFYKNLLNKEINLRYYGLDSKGIRAIAMALHYNQHVRCLNLSENFLDDDACFHLGELFRYNTTIEELNLAGCRIGASGMRRLGQHLHIYQTLNTLNISKNCLDDEGGEVLATQMCGITIQRVNLSYNSLSTKTAEMFTTLLEDNNSFTSIDLSWNNFFHGPTLAKMLDRLGDSKVLEGLNLSWNAVEGTRVAHALKKVVLIPTLTVLNLSNNRLRGEEIEMIISDLTKAKCLRTLDLSFNPLSLSDVNSVIMKMLQPRVKIENLNLENICVDKKFLMCLERVKNMKARKNFVVTYGYLMRSWTVPEPDTRGIILRRAVYLGNSIERGKVDVAVYFLKLNEEFERTISVKDLIERTQADGIPLDDDLLMELSYVFPGPVIGGSKSVDLLLMKEYIRRLWPTKNHTSSLHPST